MTRETAECKDPTHVVTERMLLGTRVGLPSWDREAQGEVLARASRERDLRVAGEPDRRGRVWLKETLEYYESGKIMERTECGYAAPVGYESHIHDGGWIPHGQFRIGRLRTYLAYLRGGIQLTYVNETAIRRLEQAPDPRGFWQRRKDSRDERRADREMAETEREYAALADLTSILRGD